MNDQQKNGGHGAPAEKTGATFLKPGQGYMPIGKAWHN